MQSILLCRVRSCRVRSSGDPQFLALSDSLFGCHAHDPLMNLLGELGTEQGKQAAESAEIGGGLSVKVREAPVDQIAAQLSFQIAKTAALEVFQYAAARETIGSDPWRPVRREAGSRPARQPRTSSSSCGSSNDHTLFLLLSVEFPGQHRRFFTGTRSSPPAIQSGTIHGADAWRHWIVMAQAGSRMELPHHSVLRGCRCARGKPGRRR